jgi:hypothetical protein
MFGEERRTRRTEIEGKEDGEFVSIVVVVKISTIAGNGWGGRRLHPPFAARSRPAVNELSGIANVGEIRINIYLPAASLHVGEQPAEQQRSKPIQ